jgi:prevent-host-death family protein
MKTVGIKELKAKLSSYINETRKGQKIIVTDHGEEVAVISPLSNEYLIIQLLYKSGKVQWTKGKPRGLDNRVALEGEPLSVTILEERK